MAEVNTENYNLFCQKADEIDNLLAKIEEDTMASSNHSKTTKHPNFKILTGMGTKIIPYLFYKITQQGCDWVHLLLLRELVGDEMQLPVEHQGRFTHILTDWLVWYINSPYQNHDVYYGLVD